MGSFSVQPSGAQAVYHPIKYTFVHVSTRAIESIRCVININDPAANNFYYTLRVPYSSKVSAGASGYTYTFNFDISAFCKQKLPPFTYQVSSAFRFSVVNYANVDNPDFWILTTTAVYPEYRNAQGVLVDDSGNATSDTITVLPASYRRGDTKSLVKYVTSGITGFLTRRPLTETAATRWCLDQEASLSIFFTQKKDTGQQIILYLEEWPTGSVTPYTEAIELSKFNTGQITFSLNSVFNNIKTNYPSVNQVRLQIVISTTGYARKSEYAFLTFDRNCCSGYTFSWLNELGGVDNYTFCGESEIELQTQNEFGEQYDDGITTRLKGYYKTDTVAGEVLQIRDLISGADLDWVKYILASHEVYVKIGTNWYNTVILDANAITESNVQGMFEFNFTARLSDVVTNHN
jgi:hypothetical protein